MNKPLYNLVVAVYEIVRTQFLGLMIAIATVLYLLGHISVSGATLLIVLGIAMLLLEIADEVCE